MFELSIISILKSCKVRLTLMLFTWNVKSISSIIYPRGTWINARASHFKHGVQNSIIYEIDVAKWVRACSNSGATRRQNALDRWRASSRSIRKNPLLSCLEPPNLPDRKSFEASFHNGYHGSFLQSDHIGTGKPGKACSRTKWFTPFWVKNECSHDLHFLSTPLVG